MSPMTYSRKRLEPEARTDPTQDPRFRQDPYPACAVMRSTCPVQATPAGAGGHTGYLVTGYAEAGEALGDARLSKDTAAFFADEGSRRRPPGRAGRAAPLRFPREYGHFPVHD
ncbi:hypothetical protein [Streptomyces sp. CLV115]|uniref:hypothetical protein n=1 Tax=Streptomyces sp. CLV115 TaxID=3138502 RepID=UPI00406CF21B